MLGVACPSCGAEIVFRSPALPARVCDSCRSLVVRRGQDVETIGKVAALPFDISPVQIGMSGSWDGQSFDIIGRVRWGWTDGAWNEWLMLFADGSHGWLGEAMGQFMALRQELLEGSMTRVLQDLVAGNTVVPGEQANIAGAVFQVSDIRTVHCIACEGELPFTAPTGWEALSVDFRSGDGSCASFQKDSNEASLYLGRYVTLAELRPANLRTVPGWTVPSYAG